MPLMLLQMPVISMACLFSMDNVLQKVHSLLGILFTFRPQKFPVPPLAGPQGGGKMCHQGLFQPNSSDQF